MIVQKGGSNNKSLYAMLFAAFAILAGTAYGAYNIVFAAKPAVEPAPGVVTNYPRKAPKAEGAADTAAKPAADANTQAATAPQPKAEAPATTVPVEHNYSILIKKSAFQCMVLDNGKVIESYGCALGKNTGDKEKSGDMKTPVGKFKVIEVCDASYWTHDFGDGKGEIKGAYGPWFFYLDTNEKSKGQWDGIGIHGTHDPSSIGTLASEGCIRLLNENVQTLKDKYIKVGTWVTIEE